MKKLYILAVLSVPTGVNDRKEVPIVPGAPSLTTVAKIGASIVATAYAGPLGAAMVSAAFSTVEVAAGNMELTHALVQTGVSFATGAVGAYGNMYASLAVNSVAGGMEYNKGGSIGFSAGKMGESFKKGVITTAVSAGMGGALGSKASSAWGQGLTSATTSFLSSGINGRGKLWEIGWHSENWNEHITTGLAAGTTSWAMAALDSGNTAVDGSGKNKLGGAETYGALEQGNWMNSATRKLISGTINQGVMMLGHGITGGRGFRTDYSSFNWDSLAYNHSDLGADLGAMAVQSYRASKTPVQKRKDKESESQEPEEASIDDRDPTASGNGNTTVPRSTLGDMLGGIWLSMKNVLGGFVDGIAEKFGGDAVDFGNDIVSGVKGLFGGDKKPTVSQQTYVANAGVMAGEPPTVDSEAVAKARDILDNFWSDKKAVTNEKIAELEKENPELAAQVKREVSRLRKVDQQIKAQKRAEADSLKTANNPQAGMMIEAAMSTNNMQWNIYKQTQASGTTSSWDPTFYQNPDEYANGEVPGIDDIYNPYASYHEGVAPPDPFINMPAQSLVTADLIQDQHILRSVGVDPLRVAVNNVVNDKYMRENYGEPYDKEMWRQRGVGGRHGMARQLTDMGIDTAQSILGLVDFAINAQTPFGQLVNPVHNVLQDGIQEWENRRQIAYGYFAPGEEMNTADYWYGQIKGRRVVDTVDTGVTVVGGAKLLASAGLWGTRKIATKLGKEVADDVAKQTTKGAEYIGKGGDGIIPNKLYHYTDEAGMQGIVDSRKLNPSLKAVNPKDARYGNGQYLSDIAPGTKNVNQLSKEFINNPFQGKRFTNYVEIDVTGMKVIKGRKGVYVIPKEKPLKIKKILTKYGKN